MDAHTFIDAWWYMANGQKHGPYGTAEMHSLLQDGSMGPDTLVWRRVPSPVAGAWMPVRLTALGAT